jgi:hypothetical protein
MASSRFQSLLEATFASNRLLTAPRSNEISFSGFQSLLEVFGWLAVAFGAVASLAIASNDVTEMGSDWKRCHSSGLVVVLAVV